MLSSPVVLSGRGSREVQQDAVMMTTVLFFRPLLSTIASAFGCLTPKAESLKGFYLPILPSGVLQSLNRCDRRFWGICNFSSAPFNVPTKARAAHRDGVYL